MVRRALAHRTTEATCTPVHTCVGEAGPRMRKHISELVTQYMFSQKHGRERQGLRDGLRQTFSSTDSHTGNV